MENDQNIEKKINKKNNFFYFLKKAIPIFLVGASLSARLTYLNYDKIVELNNVNSFRITPGAVENPYNLHIYRDNKEGYIRTYIINTRTNDTLEIKKDMNIGDLEYRIKSIIGNNEDDESINGRLYDSKKQGQEKIKEVYNKIKNLLHKK